MKKLRIHPMMRITLLFFVFLTGMFLGRNSYASDVQSVGFHLPETGNIQSVETENEPESVSVPVLNINTATSAQLQSLPGIGPVIAQRIIDYRNTNGPFPAVSHLIYVEGIGEETLTKILDYITVQEDSK